MSKLVEGVVVQQVTQHINNNNLDNPRQSAYKISHIKNKIHLSLSRGEPTALVLLDLFAAFVTIDHTTLLNCLKSWICVRYSLDFYLFIWGFTSLSTLYRSYHDG